ncbi:hypothetical protein PCL1606_05310 [Pseudomonas chlororaphis]|uniref:Uncharacterized protein n=1 Tax=Pseudomonas chlororaphis TaxID=587753 RepID=A0A0D5XSB5_9PSED|nr:hypothetical protein PCL1606_05310 [Pseudomonas chlororaphis]
MLPRATVRGLYIGGLPMTASPRHRPVALQLSRPRVASVAAAEPQRGCDRQRSCRTT